MYQFSLWHHTFSYFTWRYIFHRRVIYETIYLIWAIPKRGIKGLLTAVEYYTKTMLISGLSLCYGCVCRGGSLLRIDYWNLEFKFMGVVLSVWTRDNGTLVLRMRNHIQHKAQGSPADWVHENTTGLDTWEIMAHWRNSEKRMENKSNEDSRRWKCMWRLAPTPQEGVQSRRIGS